MKKPTTTWGDLAPAGFHHNVITKKTPDWKLPEELSDAWPNLTPKSILNRCYKLATEGKLERASVMVGSRMRTVYRIAV